MEQEQIPKPLQPEDTETIQIEEQDAKREFNRHPLHHNLHGSRQQATQLAQSRLAPRGDTNLVDLPPFAECLSKYVLAYVFSGFSCLLQIKVLWRKGNDPLLTMQSLRYRLGFTQRHAGLGSE